MEDFFIFALVGFLAQLVDASLGMAYGLTSTTLLLSLGFSPVIASATTHAAECVTTGFSALAHHQFGNISYLLFRRLLIPGMVGAMLGSYILVQIDGETIKPFIALYLLILGLVIITKVFREFPPRQITRHLIPLSFCGAFIDTIGGGGWGSIVTSTLVMLGNDVRTTIGSVSACEFFITMTATATFFLSDVEINWKMVAALATGGALASPLGAWLCKHLPVKWLLLIIGTLIICLSMRILWISLT